MCYIRLRRSRRGAVAMAAIYTVRRPVATEPECNDRSG